jgi:RNA recognition motif-containing protein
MTSEDARKLFVAGLTESIDEDQLRSLFEAAGTSVIDVSIPRDRATGKPRGFGFVTLSSESEADAARDALDGTIHSGRALSVRRFHVDPPKRGEGRAESAASSAPDGSTVYTGNLPYGVTQAELESLFVDGGFGPVVRLHMPLSPDGRSRGFGFVTLASAESAQRAVQTLHQSEVQGRRLIVNLAHAKPERLGSSDRTPRRQRPIEPREASHRSSEPPHAPSGSFSGAFLESARPVEGRRARAGEAKKKKKSKRRSPGDVPRRERGSRGGAGSWQKWTDWDED